MIYSASCEYALRALIYLAQFHNDRSVSVKEISEREDMPRQFLSKLLQTLARAGIVDSFKGPGGGFRLAYNPSQITLYDVMLCIDGDASLERCAVGLADCSDATPCPLHDQWEALRESVKHYLMRNNLQMLRTALEDKRTQLEENKVTTGLGL